MIRKNVTQIKKNSARDDLNCDVETTKKRHSPNERGFSKACFMVGSALLLFLVVVSLRSSITDDQNGQFSLKKIKDIATINDEEIPKQEVIIKPNDEGKLSPKAEMAIQKVHARLHQYTLAGVDTVGSHEPLLTYLLSSMLVEDNGELLPEGSILDCGAQQGEQGAHYAVSSPNRKVISMDPSPQLVQHMKDIYGSLENFEIRQGALGGKVGTMKPRDKSFGMDMDTEFPVYTLDSMYFDKQEKLAFAHLDLEGMEYDTLQGGLKTIRANKPVFTVELRVHETEKTKQLLDLIDREGYDTYLIDEPCGWPHIDMRNIFCIPRSRSEAFGRSNGFGLLLMMEGLKRVTSDDIAQVVLPCCALGGECCPGDDIDDQNCCTEDVVVDFYEKNKGIYRMPPVVLGFKQARTEFLRQQWRLRQRQKK